MPVTAARVRGLAAVLRTLWGPLLALLVIAVIADAVTTAALAQGTPFGAPRPPQAAPQVGGMVGWLLAKQAEFYRAMSAAVRAAKSDGSAALTLLGVSFLYGIFHAAGPGHGKAVISSYLIANEETARRGIVLSFASALLQALVAVLVVGVGAWLFNATSRSLCGAERVIELASYALIAGLGARMVWTKGRGFFGAVQDWRMARGDGHHHHHDHADHSHADHSPDDCSRGDCGHSHGPDLATIAGRGGWRRGLSAIVAVGLRPCSGAILVLVFALAQGLFWAGVAATFVMALGTAITVTGIALLTVGARDLARRIAAHRVGAGGVALRFIEFGAAGLVLLLGLALLLGQAAAERVTCF
ncbi:MAG: nickel/cobalt transporter [Xanthobacteraceae bacterium]|nr:MAG: nickel/cobalt transporter [Xanthobacteraceae bacterium]